LPGILGIISRKTPQRCEALLEAMAASMQHEPHYVSGLAALPEVGVYAGWVAHPNSFAAAQSGHRWNSDITLVFSGECLRDAGDGADRKWIIDQYEAMGEKCFAELNGLFSGLLVDRRRNLAFLFNDRYGAERLYVHEAADAVYFASEAGALLRVIPELRSFDDIGVAQYLAFGCTMGERTLFRGALLLPGGSQWTVESGTVRSKARYFEPGMWEAQEPLTADEFTKEFARTFQRVLPRYSEDGESVGIALTGGLDTRMVMACLPETQTSHPCYTFVGETGLHLDARLAARIAAVRGLEHNALRVEPNFLRNFGTHLDRTVTVTDGCAGATSTHEIYLNAKARALSPIRLTGNFGSEIFRSASTFKPLRLERNLLSGDYAARVAAESQRFGAENVHPVTFAAFREIPSNLYGLLAAGRSQLTFRTPYLDNELVALAYRAPTAQRLSALPALALIHSVSPELARIPTDRGELLAASFVGRACRRAFSEVTFKLDYYHKEGLPSVLSRFEPFLNALSPLGVLGLHKFLPYRRWFRKELASVVMEKVASGRVRQAPWWSKNAPERLARAHIAGRGNYVREINAVLTLEAVDRLFFKEVIPATSADMETALRVRSDWTRILCNEPGRGLRSDAA